MLLPSLEIVLRAELDPSANEIQVSRCRDNRTCIPKRLVCDGYEQCDDGSDELQASLSRGALVSPRAYGKMRGSFLRKE